MNLTYGIIAAVGLLIAAILGMIGMDPGYLANAPPLPPSIKPVACTLEWAPVCGVDDVTYGNLCMINAAKVEISYRGECVDSEPEPTPAPEIPSTPEPTPSPESVPEPTPSPESVPEPTPSPEQIPEPTPTPEPELEPTMEMPVMSKTHIVSAVEGSGAPGCELTNECYIPYSLEINLGDTVSWSNDDTAAHTVTAGSSAGGPSGVFDSSLFMAGTTFDFTFNEPGTYPYFCMVHPWMTGEIIVNEIEEMIAIPEENSGEPIPEEPVVEVIPAGPAEVVMAIGSGAPGCESTNECYLPYQIEVDSGETVIWTNIDSAAHTVTSGAPANHDGKFDSGMMMVNQSWEHTFSDSGEYDYHCMLHPWMKGKVMVH